MILDGHDGGSLEPRANEPESDLGRVMLMFWHDTRQGETMDLMVQWGIEGLSDSMIGRDNGVTKLRRVFGMVQDLPLLPPTCGASRSFGFW